MLNKTIHICFLLIFALCLLVSCDKITKQRARHYFEKGKKLYEAGEYIKAAKEFDNAIVFDPHFFDALYMKGMAYYQRGAFQDASNCYERAVEQRPDDTPARLAMINNYMKLKKWGRGLQQAQFLLKTDPNNRELIFLDLYMKIKSRRDSNLGYAKNKIDELVNQNYDDPRIYCLQAELEILKNNLSMAEDILMQHYTSHPVWEETMTLLADLHVASLNFKKAQEIYNSIIEKADDKHTIQKKLAALLMKNNAQEAAEKVLRAMVAQNVDNLEDKINLITCLISLKKFDDAEQMINEELKKSPDNFSLKKTMIDIYAQRGDFEATMAVAKKMLSSLQINSPQYITLKNMISDIYFSHGKYEDSRACSQEILAAFPSDAHARFNLCRMALSNKPGIGVIGELRKLISEDPGNADYFYYLGLAHKARGEEVLSQTAFEAALEKTPGHKNALIALAEIYRVRGIHRRLEKYVEIYLKFNPNDEEIKSLLQKEKQKPAPSDNNTDNDTIT